MRDTEDFVYGPNGTIYQGSVLKNISFCCALIPFAISLTFCILYWIMWKDALKQGSASASGVRPYDACGFGDIDPDFNTKWTILLGFNSVFYLVMAILTSSMILRYCFISTPYVLRWLHFFGFCTHWACLVVTGVYRNSAYG